MKFRVLTVILLSTFCIGFLNAKESPYQEYLSLLTEFEHLGRPGDYKSGSIEIVSDPKKIAEIEELQRMRLLRVGLSKDEANEASRVGIISKDTYWVLLRDAVIFPTGAEGTFNRLVLASSLTKDGVAGVVILPMLPDGRIVLNINYRHATRSWELEVPRGFRKKEETVEMAVERELEEETGAKFGSSIYLGEVAPDSGSVAAIIPVYAVKVSERGVANQDYSEAILTAESFSIQEIKDGYARGFIEMPIKGKKERVYVRDPFLSYALLQAEMKKLL